MLLLTSCSVCSHLGLFSPIYSSFPEFCLLFLFILSCKSDCYGSIMASYSMWRQQRHVSHEISFQAFPLLFILQVTKAGGEGLETRLLSGGTGKQALSITSESTQKSLTGSELILANCTVVYAIHLSWYTPPSEWQWSEWQYSKHICHVCLFTAWQVYSSCNLKTYNHFGP